MTLPDNLAGLLQAILAALIAYAGVRYTGRRAEKAAEATQGSADLKAAAEEWRTLKDEYRDRLEAVEARQARTEEDLEKERDHSRRQDRDLYRLRRALDSWIRWADYLVENWDAIRAEPTPPTPPSTPHEMKEKNR